MALAPDRRVFGLKSSPKGASNLQQIASATLTQEPTLGTPENPLTFATGRPSNAAPVVESAVPLEANKQYSFTGKYAGYDNDLRGQEADLGFSRRDNIQKIAAAFLKATQTAAEQKEKSRRSLMQMLADRGMSTSGITLDKGAELETNYTRYLDDIANSRASDQSDVENNYARGLNSIYRKRNSLFGEQQAEEQQRRMEEARVAAETARQTAEANARSQELEAIKAAQAAATQAAQAQTASYAPSYTAPSFSYGGGGGGGGGDYSAPYEEPAPPPVQEERIISPFINATGNVPGGAVEAWVKRTVDPNLSGANLRAVISAMTNAGSRGLTRTELASIIAQNSQPQNPDFFY